MPWSCTKLERIPAMRQPPNSGIVAGAWGFAAGLVGSLCCIGPSAAILLGLGSSSALLGLALDRTLTQAGGAALLLTGMVLALRRSRACDPRAARRWRAPALMLASFALAYGLLGLLAPTLAARQEDVESQRQSLNLVPLRAVEGPKVAGVAAAPRRRLTLLVEKMDCPPCAAHIRALLKRKPFVRGFVAEWMVDQVTIDYDGGQANAKSIIALFPAYFGVTQISDEAIR